MKKLLSSVPFLLVLIMISCSQQAENKADVDIDKQPMPAAPLFKQVLSKTSGVSFANTLPLDERINIFTYEYYYNGGGVAAGDVNNDGLPDLYFTSNLGDNKLYLNKGGVTFEDITESAGVSGGSGWSTGVTMVDINNDGFLDIYVCRSGRFDEDTRKNQLFINNQDNTFTENAQGFGLADSAYSTQALFFDLDKDNDLDMFLLNHSIELFSGKRVKEWREQKDMLAGDKLFRNDNGKFINITNTSGINNNAMGYGLGIAAGDLNGDGWTDIYVTNDYLEPDYMYINNKNGTFTESIKTATGHISNFGMGVDIADFNNDGLVDVAVNDMVAEDNYRQKTNMKSMNPDEFYQAVEYGFHYQYMFNALQLNRGEGLFSEIGQMAGVSNTDWSWTTLFSDLNNDGWKDIFITNGFRKEFGNKDFVNYRNAQTSAAMNAPREQRIKVVRDLLSKMKDGKTVNYVFENKDGLSYEKRNVDWGIDVPSFSNGGVTVDLDNDGDLELVVNNIDQEAFIFDNQTSEGSGFGYLKVKLNGPNANQFGVGAKVIVTTEEQIQTQENFPTRGYQSAVEPILNFGLGKQKPQSIEVIWPDGKREIVNRVTVNSQVEMNYANAVDVPSKETVEASLFVDITSKAGIQHKHEENNYNDFKKEALLPHKMSQFGPALAVADVNGDELEDFYLGGAKGQEGQLFTQSANGTFAVLSDGPWVNDKYAEDVGATFFDADGDGDQDLYVASGGNEFKQGQSQLNDRLYINEGGTFVSGKERLPRVNLSGSVVVSGDFDKDGDLDLFVGGRLVPGKYPLPASSVLLRNDQGKFSDVTRELAPGLNRIGMVTSAIWTDYDSNGDLDLLLSGEWMSPQLFKNDGGSLVLVESSSLAKHVGWWYSLAQGDFDGDGDMDYIGGNLGLNYKYKASSQEPFKVYADDFDKNGSLDIVLGYFNNGELFPLRGRQCSSEQMPFIKNKFESYHDFGLATLDQVYGEEELSKSLHYEATNFASSYIENLGNGEFEFVALPPLAQISSVNGILVDDFDQDGHLDLVTAGNLYPVEVETIRNDASYGLFLKGSGDGTFIAVDLIESGLKIKGDVKQLKLIQLSSGHKGLIAGLNDDIPVLVQVR